MNWLNQIHVGDATQLLHQMAADGVKAQTCITSPPYYGLRCYGHDAQLGHEPTLQLFISNLADCFDAVWDVLEDNGTLWVNMGDAYCSSGGTGHQGRHGVRNSRTHTQRNLLGQSARRTGLSPKDLMGQPWRLAFALQDRGWILRRDIIWEKPACMPESAKDRPTTSHEYIFMFVKQRYYLYNREAIAEPTSPNTHLRVAQDVANQAGSVRANGGVRADRPMKAVAPGVNPKPIAGWMSGPGSHKAKDHAAAGAGTTKFKARPRSNSSMSEAISGSIRGTRNSRSVWRFASEPFNGNHFATFPRELPRRCILVGSNPGDTVLDPFMGSGTTAEVASNLGRNFVGMEINPAYAKMAYTHRNLQVGMPMPTQHKRA